MKRRLLVVFAAALLALSCHSTEEILSPRTLPLKEVEVTAWCWGYDPAYVAVWRGQPVRLRVKSIDVEHTLTCEKLGIDLKIPARGGAEQVVEFTIKEIGDYYFICQADCGPARSRQIFRLNVSARPGW